MTPRTLYQTAWWQMRSFTVVKNREAETSDGWGWRDGRLTPGILTESASVCIIELQP